MKTKTCRVLDTKEKRFLVNHHLQSKRKSRKKKNTISLFASYHDSRLMICNCWLSFDNRLIEFHRVRFTSLPSISIAIVTLHVLLLCSHKAQQSQYDG